MAGWKDILWRLRANLKAHRLVSIAAGVTYYALLAIFPGIGALVALYGLIADPGTIGKHLNELSGLLPGGAIEVMSEQLARLSARPNTLGLTAIFGLVVSLWSANSGMKALFDALNIAYGEKERRGFIRLNALSLAFTLGVILFIILALGVLTVLPNLIDRLGLTAAMQWLMMIGKWPLLLVVVVWALALIYRYGPDREPAKWRWISWGSIFAAAGWMGVSALFSFYAAHLGSFSKTYGSLGAVMAFMVWIWLSSLVILIGAELDAEMEHQTARDTTTGPEQPLGRRGAQVADTIGPARR